MSEPMIAFLDCPSGVSGDMLLGALLDAGLDLEMLRDGLKGLDLDGYALTAESVLRDALGATHARVVLGGEGVDVAHVRGHVHKGERGHKHDRGEGHADDAVDEHEHVDRDDGEGDHDNASPLREHDHERVGALRRTLPDILALIARGSLPSAVKDKASAVFLRLAVAEARVHRVPIEDVHFHEVGAVDAIVDIVGVCLGLHLLGVEIVYCSPLPLARGRAAMAHGTLPLPAPATLEILAGVAAPTIPHPALLELVTPTGAALVAELAVFAQPPMQVVKVGYGAGTRTEPAPNLLRLWLGRQTEGAAPRHGGVDVFSAARPLTEDMRVEALVVLEANIDDMSGEMFGHAMERLMAAGALDAWCTGVTMKKGRPGVLLGALCHPSLQTPLVDIIMRETSTLGVRAREVTRYRAAREGREVETPYGPVRVVLKLLDGHVAGASPEYEDCKRQAAIHGVALPLVYAAAVAAAAPLIRSRLAEPERRGDAAAASRDDSLRATPDGGSSS